MSSKEEEGGRVTGPGGLLHKRKLKKGFTAQAIKKSVICIHERTQKKYVIHEMHASDMKL